MAMNQVLKDAIPYSLFSDEENSRLDADNVFIRLRRKALRRRLWALLGFGRPPRLSAEAWRSGEFEVSIDEIAGLSGSRAARGLPAMPRRLACAWQREFLRARDSEAFEAFRLRWVAGRWYLEGGLGELIRLELLRHRGETIVHATSMASAGLARVERKAPDVEDCTECGDLVAS